MSELHRMKEWNYTDLLHYVKSINIQKSVVNCSQDFNPFNLLLEWWAAAHIDISLHEIRDLIPRIVYDLTEIYLTGELDTSKHKILKVIKVSGHKPIYVYVGREVSALQENL